MHIILGKYSEVCQHQCPGFIVLLAIFQSSDLVTVQNGIYKYYMQIYSDLQPGLSSMGGVAINVAI